MNIVAETTYTPTDILVTSYLALPVAEGGATQHETFIERVTENENISATGQTVNIIVVNSSPLCGSPYGRGSLDLDGCCP